jgi:hypothetical protein
MAEYHLHTKTHSRGVGKGAGGHVRYILREGSYAEKKVEQADGSAIAKTRVSRADEVLHAESGNMPAWAHDPADYWDAADQYERANGTVYREIEFSLPMELPDVANILLAQDFAKRLATVPDGVTPYTLAIHRSEKDPSLLHCHLMLSDKINDGITRDPGLWFKRAAAARTPKQKGKDKKDVDPANGGAKKTQARISHEWIGEVVRPLWAELANKELERAGYESVRIDHRTLDAQREEAEQQAEQARALGDLAGYKKALERAASLDHPPQPKRGRVLEHAPEKAPRQAAKVIEYELEKAARQAAAQAVKMAQVEAITVKEALEQAEQILERAQLRHGYRRDAWEIRERWSFRQQQRERDREAERLLEEHERQEQEELALDELVAEETASGVRHLQRSTWREWRAQTLSRKYDPAYSAEMAERDVYCRWMPEHGGGLYLRLGKQEVIDRGPLLLAKNGALDIPLLIATAQGKGWDTLAFTGSPEFQEKAAVAALQAGLAVADADLSQRAQAVIHAQREQERIDAAKRAGIPDVVGLARNVSPEVGRGLCALIETHGTLEATADALAARGMSSNAIAVGITYLVNERYRGHTKDRQQLTNEAAAQIGREAILHHQQKQPVKGKDRPGRNKGHGLGD